ncbi:hypothetical protein A2985_03845 [Candidatus Woesebacteria bacterium RIFCSPLOWO2_01_FULL_43_11]|nr:MAG: hypothetical protein A2985_03845 [Candidatus Woesebacteria bacterium RIFCSPLOWO2_01_FULL_43_11]
MDPVPPSVPMPQQPPASPSEPTPNQMPAAPQSNISGGTNKGGFIARAAASIADGFVIGFATTLLSMLLKAVGLGSSISQIVNGLIYIVYVVLAIGLYGKTLGKAAFGLRVVNYENVSPGIPMAILREVVGKFISSLVLNLGFLWIIWDKNKQGWHDKIAKTYVLQEVPFKGFKKVLAYILVLGLPVLAILGIIAVVGVVTLLPGPSGCGFRGCL